MAEDMSAIFIKSKLTVGVSRLYTEVAADEIWPGLDVGIFLLIGGKYCVKSFETGQFYLGKSKNEERTKKSKKINKIEPSKTSLYKS